MERIASCYKWNLKKNPGWYINIENTARYVSSSLDSACKGIRHGIWDYVQKQITDMFMPTVHTCLRNCFPK